MLGVVESYDGWFGLPQRLAVEMSFWLGEDGCCLSRNARFSL